MKRGALTAGLVTGAVILTAAVAAGASGELVAWEDRFERESGPLGGPWIDPGDAYRVDEGSGRAFATGAGAAWRDTGVISHEIEVTPYKLTDPGPGNSIGGVTVGLVDANNFVGYELVKTTRDFMNGPESKSVLYLRIAGQETVIREVLHPELVIDQTVNLRLRKHGQVVETYLDGVLDVSYTLDAAQAAALNGTNAGLLNLAGRNNYFEARAYDLVNPPPSPPAPSTPVPTPSTTPPAPAPTATPSSTPTSPGASEPPTTGTFRDSSGDLRAGADLRRLTVASGKRTVITSTHRALRRAVGVQLKIYVDATAARAGPEYLLRTAVGRAGDGWSVRRVNGWLSAGTKVSCASARNIDYASDKVRFSLGPACLGRGDRLRIAAVATQGGLADWAPSRRAFYPWLSR